MNRRVLLAWAFVVSVSILDVIVLHLYINRPDMEVNPVATWVYNRGGILAVVIVRATALGYVFVVSRFDEPAAKGIVPFLLGVYFILFLQLAKVLFQVLT